MATAVGDRLMPMSGKDMLKLFLKDGWLVLRQKGSHIAVGKHGQVETIPMHRELAKGTEHALLKRLRTKENQGK
jgi:predicted RNA binding protein YcfA (HicA-like mRNA interferase family)